MDRNIDYGYDDMGDDYEDELDYDMDGDMDEMDYEMEARKRKAYRMEVNRRMQLEKRGRISHAAKKARAMRKREGSGQSITYDDPALSVLPDEGDNAGHSMDYVDKDAPFTKGLESTSRIQPKKHIYGQRRNDSDLDQDQRRRIMNFIKKK